MIPGISDIPDKYGNLALMSSLSVLHEDRVQTSLSVNKLTRCYYAMSELDSRRQNKSLFYVSKKKNQD